MSASPNAALHYQTLESLASSLDRGELSSVEICRQFAERIDALDPRLGAFRQSTLEPALERAAALDAERARGERRSALHGLPFAAKDLFNVAGLATTAGCRVLEQAIAGRDAEVIRRLDAAGMILLGKTNTVQFAYGGAGVNTHHGTPHNPWHRELHLPGGSSSGSGVAVAAGLAPMALGTDTGGSVRIPASLCGISGLKTTVGRISREGVYPLSWSLDSVGPLARTAKDCALVFDVLNGEHAGDATTHGRPAVSITPAHDVQPSVKGLRMAIARSVFFDDADPQTAAAVESAADVFRELGAQVDDIAFPQATEAVSINPRGLVIAAEAYTLNRQLVDEHFDALDPVVSHRIVKGKEVTAEDYLSTVCAWGQLRERTMAALADIDLLICPATMIPAQPVAPLLQDIDAYSRANLSYLRNTAIGNILNLCGISLPAGATNDRLPLGVMLYAKPFHEATLVRAAIAFQSGTEYHDQTPDLSWASSE